MKPKTGGRRAGILESSANSSGGATYYFKEGAVKPSPELSIADMSSSLLILWDIKNKVGGQTQKTHVG